MIIKAYHDTKWWPRDFSKTLKFSVVDEQLGGNDNLQSYFAAPWSVRLDGALCDTRNCCTTVTILIVVMCLRFQCKDPQRMVNIIRCIMRHLRNSLNKGDLIRFLLQIRRWQNHLAGEDLSDEAFQYWLGITCKPGTQLCHCVLQNGTSLCPQTCERGTVWCSEHIAKKKPLSKPWMGTKRHAQGIFVP